MSDTGSLGSRSSIAKIQDFFHNGYTYAGDTASTGTGSRHPQRSGAARSVGLVAKHIFLLGVVITTVVLLVVVGRVPSWNSTSHAYAGKFNNCNANGTFTPSHSPTFSLWDGSGLFQITLTWGDMTFSQAKAIDVVWDIVVGRGGQAILLYVSFHVFTMTLSRTMETDPVSYGTFESMAFTSPTFVSPFILIRDFVSNRGVRAKVAVAWTIIASIFVLAFPSLNDTMSGYSTNMEAFLMDNSGILVPWSNYSSVQFVIQDGERVGLSNPAYITDDPSSANSCASKGPHPFTLDGNETMSTVSDTNQGKDWAGVPENCTLFWHVVEYAATYGFSGDNHTASIFNRSGEIQTLEAPTLNITSMYDPSYFAFLADSLNTAPASDKDINDYVQDDLSTALWIWKGEVYNLSYVLAEGECFPLMTHNWGFSFLFLFIVMFMTAVWSIGMYVMWMDAYLNSRYSRAGRDLGTYRASWDFAEAMRQDMGDGVVTEAMSNKQVKRRVRQARNGDRVRYQMADPDVPVSRLDELRIWWSGVDGVDVRRRRTRMPGGGRGEQKHRPTSLEPFAQYENDSMLDPPLLTGSSSAFRSPLPPYMEQSRSQSPSPRFYQGAHVE